MPYILVGFEAARCILSVEKVPEVGEVLEIKKDMIVWAATELASTMAGWKYQITERCLNNVETPYGILPWFGVKNQTLIDLGLTDR